MSKKRKLVGRLKDGQKVIGVLEDYNEDFAKFSDQDGNEIQLTMFGDLEHALEDGDYGSEIVEVSRTGNEYEIFVHDTWPKESKKES